MYQNDVVCDLYIGKNAGNKIIEEINTAKSSVKIISPYISPSTIWHLIKLHRKGVQVELVTTDAVMDQTEQAEKTFKVLIKQEKEYNKKGAALKKTLHFLQKLLWGSFAIALLATFYFYIEEQSSNLGLGIIISLTLLVLGIYVSIKTSQQNTFQYKYESLFPLKLLIAPENSEFPIKTFIHSKVFIIDEKIMYWGSINFTSMGVKDNYETRVRTTDTIAIQKMTKEFNQLLQSNNLPERYLNIWGRMIYSLDKND